MSPKEAIYSIFNLGPNWPIGDELSLGLRLRHVFCIEIA